MKSVVHALAAIAAMASFSTLGMAEDCLEVGSGVGAFYVTDVTGPAAGTKLCYRCRFKDRPVVSIFTREMNDNVAALIKEVDGTVSENQGRDMAAFVVLLTDNPEGQEAALKKVAQSQGIQNTPLTTFDGVAGPPSYKLPKEGDVTVMMWVDGKLKVNETLSASDLSSAKISTVVKKSSEILN